MPFDPARLLTHNIDMWKATSGALLVAGGLAAWRSRRGARLPAFAAVLAAGAAVAGMRSVSELREAMAEQIARLGYAAGWGDQALEVSPQHPVAKAAGRVPATG